MIELEDVGRNLLLTFADWNSSGYKAEVKVQMVIKAPRGTIVLFDSEYVDLDYQCKGIRAFMEEHQDD